MGIFRLFLGPKIIPKRANFYGGSRNVGSDNASHYKEYACKIAKQLSYSFSFYHLQRREKFQTEKIVFKNRVKIFLFMLIHYLHNTS